MNFQKNSKILSKFLSSPKSLYRPHFDQIFKAAGRGGFRWGVAGGLGWTPLPSGIGPPADPKGPPFDTFSEIHFCPTDPKIFLIGAGKFLKKKQTKKRVFRHFLKNFDQ